VIVWLNYSNTGCAIVIWHRVIHGSHIKNLWEPSLSLFKIT